MPEPTKPDPDAQQAAAAALLLALILSACSGGKAR